MVGAGWGLESRFESQIRAPKGEHVPQPFSILGLLSLICLYTRAHLVLNGAHFTCLVLLHVHMIFFASPLCSHMLLLYASPLLLLYLFLYEAFLLRDPRTHVGTNGAYI